MQILGAFEQAAVHFFEKIILTGLAFSLTHSQRAGFAQCGSEASFYVQNFLDSFLDLISCCLNAYE